MNAQIKPIRNEVEYRHSLDELKVLFDAPKGTSAYDRAEVLEILLEDYENKAYPIESLDPIDAIIYVMEENGMNQTELGKVIGDKSKTSLILNRKRKLSISMIRNLNEHLKIPLNILIKEYPIVNES